MSKAALLARIEVSAPRRPWCGSKKDHCRVRPLATAIGEPYLQLNPPAHSYWLQLDIDRPAASHAWSDRNLPPPTYVVVNPANGHAQYGYALAAPVCVTDAARRKPLAFLAAIEYAYTRRLDADQAFHGPLAKNPLHPSWHLWQPANDPAYELNELAEYVDLPSQAVMRAGRLDTNYAGLGRNCLLFEQLRALAYVAVRAFWRPGGLDAFQERLLVQAESLNATLTSPLGYSEVRSIARSIARWVWKEFSPSAFREIQAARGRASAAARQEASKALRQQARAAAVEGFSTRSIAGQLGVNQSTVVRWLNDSSSSDA